ncbi:Ubiquitin-activating enzyme E1 2 [Forsythia ovata]|uniref:Ubiquitin-activating enzyme E1 2 n=1 Tax=Forsythia ovata TaxID=205694 RepID=A0ABD1XDK4_9LAMI
MKSKLYLSHPWLNQPTMIHLQAILNPDTEPVTPNSDPVSVPSVSVVPNTDRPIYRPIYGPAVVFTDISFEKAIQFDDYCHKHQPPIAFIKSDVRGLFGSVFCDFGPKFTVFDIDGEDDTANYATYAKCGIATQVKEPKVLNFKPLQEALKDPGDFLLSDFSKVDRPPLLHLAFQALDKFILNLGRFPLAGSEEDAQKLISLVTDINNSLPEGRLQDIDQKLLRNFVFGARAVLNPMAAMFGGIVGQEVVKACSGKFHPLFQFFYFDSIESLPSESLDSNDLKPLNCPYDAQISVFGSKLQKKLENAKIFIVGSGALECEFLKNVALMGVCCGDGGKLTITDDDVIKKSNLSRQFLFRDWNIWLEKSCKP